MRGKREHQRSELDAEVLATSRDGQSWTTRAVDISLGGMFLSGEPRAPIGAEIAMTFDMPHLGRVTLPAFIRWSSARGFGVQFGPIGARETHVIGRLVRDQPAALSTR